MKKIIISLTALSMSLGLLTGTAAVADTRGTPEMHCAPGKQACAKQVGHSPQPAAPAKKTGHAPKPGQNARSAPVLQQSRPSRLPAPPPHQEYRVLDGNVVRVDSQTLKVIAVVGLLNELMK
jgi:hypothetical protein